MTLKSFLISAITNMSLEERTMNHTFVALIKFYHSFLASYFSLFLCRLPHLTQNLLKITNKSGGNASPRINSFLAPPATGAGTDSGDPARLQSTYLQSFLTQRVTYQFIFTVRGPLNWLQRC